MATITSSPVRKSLPLSERDIADLQKLRRSTEHRAALSRLASERVDESSSEAALLHALVEAGKKAVREAVEEAGYAELAADYDASRRKASARRRRPQWADDK